MISIKEFSGFVTHSGIYHSDDVIAAVLINIFTDKENDFVRCTNQELESVTAKMERPLVFDIGGGTLDHHQEKGVPTYPDGCKYCSAALIWDEFGKEYLTGAIGLHEGAANIVKQLIHDRLLHNISGIDNYGPKKYQSDIAMMINNCNNYHTFQVMVAIVTPLIEGVIKAAILDSRAIYKHDLFNFTGPILDVGEYVSASLVRKEVQFIISPSQRGGWNCLSTDNDTHPVVAIKGENGCTFVHASRFIAAFEEREQAVRCAENSIIGGCNGK